jgi:hypothetical protein
MLENGPGSDPSSHRLTLLDRQISQQGSRWLVRYQIRYDGPDALELAASDLQVDYDAWVSNSRSKPHTSPRRSQTRFSISESSAVQTTVISNTNERQRCRERISLAVSCGEKPLAEPVAGKMNLLPIRVASGQFVWLYFSFEHEHFLYGNYDPLFGERKLDIQLGPCRLIDSLVLDTEQSCTIPPVKLSNPPKERLDNRQFRSGPDSLYLAADVPGYQYFRFDDMPVRYGTRFKLSFWYLVAVGTEGSCHTRVMEYQDTPNAWYRLDGGFDEPMAARGRWRQFEHTFTTRDETTTMALDFRIVGANVGEMWIDDIELSPLVADADIPDSSVQSRQARWRKPAP